MQHATAVTGVGPLEGEGVGIAHEGCDDIKRRGVRIEIDVEVLLGEGWVVGEH
jgi:hypothetical protein